MHFRLPVFFWYLGAVERGGRREGGARAREKMGRRGTKRKGSQADQYRDAMGKMGMDTRAWTRLGDRCMGNRSMGVGKCGEKEGEGRCKGE